MDSTTPEQVMQQVQALLERRRTTQARVLLQAALATNPQHTGLLMQAAWTDYLDDRGDEALATVKQVLASQPHHESARLLYFELLVKAERYVEAEPVIIELLRDYPEHAPYYGRYASLMLHALKLPKARQLAQEGLKSDPDDTDCLGAITICDFIEQRDRDTSGALQRLLAYHPQSAQTLVLVAVALQQRGDLKEARHVSQELVRAQPDNTPLVEMAHQLKLSTHWSMVPMWPMQRFGWVGSIVIWLIALFGLRIAANASPALGAVSTVVFLVYVVYSWTWPAILKKLMPM